MPIIAQEGERVLPRGASVGGSTVHVHVDVTGARGNAEIEAMVSQSVARGGRQADTVLADKVHAIVMVEKAEVITDTMRQVVPVEPEDRT